MNIFIAFANQDRDVRDKLLRQMNLVKDRQGWNIWSSKEIKAGERWDDEIKQRLMDSEVVILLLSTDFFNSKYIVETELPKVVEKHRLGNCQIIPVIARVCHWKETAFGEYAELGDIQALPAGEKPITSKVHWGDEDQPYFEVVEGMKEAIRAFQGKKKESVAAALAAEAQRAEAAQREREAQARHQQEQAQRAENERLAQLRQAQAQEARPAAQAAWQQAADAHTLPAYEAYLLMHPQGEYAREASYRIKGLKWQQTVPLPWGRYAALGGGGLAVLLVLWMVFGRGNDPESDGLTSSQPITTPAQAPAPKSGFDMVPVTGGTFTMGCKDGRDSDCYDDEKPAHTVNVRDFAIGRYEITQADWHAVMGSDPPELNFKGCDQCPVERVSWDDIQDFIKKANTKYASLLGGKKYRLPSEAEWEYAARGGNFSGNLLYAGSKNLGDVAWHSSNSDNKTHPVGEKKFNELGLFDMSGNVWEWCADDWHSNYTGAPANGGAWAGQDTRGGDRVNRGGSWLDGPLLCRAAMRGYNSSAGRGNHVGLRLALSSQL